MEINDKRTMHSFTKWCYAAKIDSWPKILIPYIFGHCLGLGNSKEQDWTLLFIGSLCIIPFITAICFLNDYSDSEVDTIKRTLFPSSCSPKTIPDGILSKKSLGLAGTFSIFTYLLCCSIIGYSFSRPLFPFLAFFHVGILYCYSFGLVRLNYRGGGEILEALGVGLLLPYSGAYLQSGATWDSQYWIMAGWFPLALSSALASGLSDEDSDRIGGKSTFTTIFGNQKVRHAIITCIWVGVTVSICLCMQHGKWPILINFVPLAWIYGSYKKLSSICPQAKTRAFAEQKILKKNLHDLLWRWQTSFAILFILNVTI